MVEVEAVAEDHEMEGRIEVAESVMVEDVEIILIEAAAIS